MKQLALLTVPVLLLCLSILLLRPSSPPLLLSLQTSNSDRRLSVFLSDLPRALNYGLLDLYWSLPAADSRIPASSDPDHPAPRTRPPYPNLIKQYSAEYWLLASLRPDSASANSSVRVVADWREADVCGDGARVGRQGRVPQEGGERRLPPPTMWATISGFHILRF